MSEISDKSLIERLLNPSTREEAFRILVEQEGPRLYNRVRRIVQYHADADDVMQNTFLKAWMALDTFRAESKVSTWLHRIAINECLTLLGKRRPMQSLDGEAEELSAEIKNLEGDTYFDGDAAQLKLQEAIDTLPEKQRIVFNLKYFEEMKYEEMSALLGTSVGALKASYHLAVKKIEQICKEED